MFRCIITVWIGMFIFLLTGALEAAEPRPVIAVVGEASLRDSSSLLAAVLTEGNAVSLVEREDLDRVLEEWNLNAQGLSTADSVKIGKLLHADGLLLMQKSSIGDSSKISLRLVAVRPGIVLSHEIYTDGVFTPDGIRTVIAPHLATRWPKLLIKPDEAIPLSFAGLHSTESGITMRNWERELNWLLEYRLIQHPKVFLLERQSMRLLTEEKYWDEDDSSFLTGQAVLEGRFEEVDGKLHINAFVKQPGGRKDIDLRVEGSAENLPALADRLARQILDNLDAGSATGSWSAEEESRFYHEMAAWAMDHYLLAEAQAASESAWALGGRGDALNELRMRAYCTGAYPAWGTFRRGSFSNGYSFYAVDVRKEPERLESAIRATEILVDHLQSKPHTEQDYSAFHDQGDVNYDYRILSARVLLNAARLLRCFYEDDAAAGHHERLVYLRKLIRMALDTLIRDERELDERQMWVYRIQSAYAAYIYERPEDVVAAYRTLIERDIEAWMFHRDPATWVWGPSCTDPSDGCIRHRRPKNTFTPFVLGWDEEEEERARTVWTGFLEELKASKKRNEQAAYWAFATFNKMDEIPPEATELLREFAWEHQAELLDARKPVKLETPFKYGEPIPGLLPVTRFWSSWTHLEGKFNGIDFSGFHYADGKIWGYQYSPFEPGKIIGIDLATFKKEIIPPPPDQYIQSLAVGGSATPQDRIFSFAVGGGHLFAASQDSVFSYDLKTGKWKPIAVPKSSYRLQFIRGHCYLMFGTGNFMHTFHDFHDGDSNDPSGVYRYDPRDDQLKLLTSTRRRPAQSELDSVPRYKPIRITRAQDGSLYLQIETDRHGRHHSFYKSDPEGDDWKLSFTIQVGSPPVITRDPGGLLVEVDSRSYQYFPDLGDPKQMHCIVTRTADRRKNADADLKWLPPASVLYNPEIRCGVMSATEAFGRFWLFSIRNMGSKPILHRYNDREAKPTDIPLDFRISKEEQLRIREVAGKSSNVPQVAAARRERTVSRLRQISQVIPVPGGFVLVNRYGFWHLPLSEIKSYTTEPEAISATAAETQGFFPE